MNSSRLFNTVKRYYDAGIYTDGDVAKFVEAGKLTKAEYKEITGKPYKEG